MWSSALLLIVVIVVNNKGYKADIAQFRSSIAFSNAGVDVWPHGVGVQCDGPETVRVDHLLVRHSPVWSLRSR